jgi:hypothetical protein
VNVEIGRGAGDFLYTLEIEQITRWSKLGVREVLGRSKIKVCGSDTVFHLKIRSDTPSSQPPFGNIGGGRFNSVRFGKFRRIVSDWEIVNRWMMAVMATTQFPIFDTIIQRKIEGIQKD